MEVSLSPTPLHQVWDLSSCLPCRPSGGLLCLTTRSNLSNLPYKTSMEAMLDKLEQSGAWERLVAWPVDQWELATSEQEVVSDPSASTADPSFISGIVYLYRKSLQRPQA